MLGGSEGASSKALGATLGLRLDTHPEVNGTLEVVSGAGLEIWFLVL